MTSIRDSNPSRNKVGFAVLHARAQQFTEPAAHQRREHQVAGLLLAGTDRRDQPHPTPNVALSEDRERVPHGVDFTLEAEGRGIQITQQAVADRRFRL